MKPRIGIFIVSSFVFIQVWRCRHACLHFESEQNYICKTDEPRWKLCSVHLCNTLTGNKLVQCSSHTLFYCGQNKKWHEAAQFWVCLLFIEAIIWTTHFIFSSELSCHSHLGVLPLLFQHSVFLIHRLVIHGLAWRLKENNSGIRALLSFYIINKCNASVGWFFHQQPTIQNNWAYGRGII